MGKFYIEISDNVDEDGNIIDGDVVFTFGQEEEAPPITTAKVYTDFIAFFIENGYMKTYTELWYKHRLGRGQIEEVDAPTDEAAASQEGGTGAPAL